MAKSGARSLTVQCCIAGGGPAGMMLGYLLARAGVHVAVLEKHEDFLRDFRGDTVHPSTMEAMFELGLLQRFLKRPHDEMAELSGQLSGQRVRVADFRHLPTHAKFVAIMPQWDFLNFLVEEARRFPEFHIEMCAEATELKEENGKIVGLGARTPQGLLDIRADLVVGADGRTSILRDKAGLKVRDLGAPIDVLWMRLPRHPGDADTPLGHLEAGQVFVMIARGDYFQCGYLVPKGGYDAVRAAGLDALRQRIAAIAPLVKDRLGTLKDWDDIKLLTVTVDRLEQWWRPGLLFIGDAAHAMSPVGGVGINLAVQDAVAAANILAEPLRRGEVADADLARVQARRLGPVRMIQRLQLLIQDRVLGPIVRGGKPVIAPLGVRLLDRFAVLRRIPARIVGMGFRMEHVRTPDAHQG
jgi:2-polyprenyl-6-methoxyphenol hydroxylase-like FAD-dependent oxidoreductase